MDKTLPHAVIWYVVSFRQFRTDRPADDCRIKPGSPPPGPIFILAKIPYQLAASGVTFMLVNTEIECDLQVCYITRCIPASRLQSLTFEGPLE
jgi:hypothetical protein